MHFTAHNNLTYQLNAHGEGSYAAFSKWQRILWCMMFAVSGLVFFEPAPVDLVGLGLFGLFMLTGLRIPNDLHFFIICIGLFISFSFLSSINAYQVSDATMHIVVTTFLVIMGIFVACVLASGDKAMAELLWRGWMIAAVVATLAGVIGYLELFPGADQFTRYGRAQGTFKDPNVFGPFLVPPAVYAFMKYIHGKDWKRFLYIGVLAFISVGVLLSFSRAAWAHFIVSLLIAMAAIALTAQRPSERYSLVVFIIVAGVIGVLGLSVLLNIESFKELFLHRFSLTQGYDSGGQGRFDGQAKAATLILENPWGIGANEFLRYWHEAPHSVYLTNFLSGGWVAGLAYIALIIATVFIGFKTAFSHTPYRFHMIIAISSFAFLAVVGFVVDSDHWRHFFVLLGAVWGLHIASRRTA